MYKSVIHIHNSVQYNTILHVNLHVQIDIYKKKTYILVYIGGTY